MNTSGRKLRVPKDRRPGIKDQEEYRRKDELKAGHPLPQRRKTGI